MKTIQIAEVKKELAQHLEYVRSGGTVRIVDHDHPVADLVPISADNDSDDDAVLARMEKRGLVRRGEGGPIPADLLQPGPVGHGTDVLDALIEERRTSR